MRQITDQQYIKFSPEERVELTIAAISRDDITEAERLWQTCPKHIYETHDLEYTQRINTLVMIGSVFFEKCVTHYNLIKKADTFIMCLEQELQYEESNHLEDFAKKSQNTIALVNKVKEINIAQLKGLHDGFNQFCTAIGINSGNLLKTIQLVDSCHDIDFFLASDTQSELQYAHQTKELFLSYWHF